MSKQVIRLTESDIHGIVCNVLNEFVGTGLVGRKKIIQPLHMYNGRIVLVHQSTRRIEDGFVNGRGKPKNIYTSNSDYTNYFWASETPGWDNSNTTAYQYYCLAEPESVYDYEENPKGYSRLKEAVWNEQFVSVRWRDGAIVVVSEHPTRIDYIKADSSSMVCGVYDRDWNLLRTPMMSLNGRGGGKVDKKLLKMMEAGKDVPVPDFLDQGYSYYDLAEKV